MEYSTNMATHQTITGIEKVTDFPSARFHVTVEGDAHTEHNVTLTREYYEHLTSKACSPEELIRYSFEFLLEREGNTAILHEFDVVDINRYFPQYEQTIQQYFSKEE